MLDSAGEEPDAGHLAESIASLIETEIRQKRLAALPSIRVLARRFDTSRHTITKSVHILRDKGILRFHRGQRPRVVDRDVPEEQVFGSSLDSVCAVIRQSIKDGTYEAGDLLPKRAYFCITMRVSAHTVSAAHRKLIKEGLVRKVGAGFVVGNRSAPATGVDVGGRFRPTILIFTKKSSTWASICGNSRTRAFGAKFISEGDKFGIRMQLITAEPERRDPKALHFSKLNEVATSLGGSLLGTLVAASEREIPDLFRYMAPFTAKGRTVWLDRYNEPVPPAIRALPLTRCHFDQTRAVELAMEYLHARGHRGVAFCCTAAGDWEEERMALCSRIGNEIFHMHVYGHVWPQHEHWRQPRSSGIDDLLDRLSRLQLWQLDSAQSFFAERAQSLIERFGEGMPEEVRESPHAGFACYVNALRMELISPVTQEHAHADRIWAALGLAPILLHPEVTALICPSDRIARLYHLRQLARLGKKVPEHVSVISFDNDQWESLFPLTTVDFGFGYLGYQAFHAILADIAVNRKKNGDIPAAPRLIDRGTVAAVHR